MGPERFVIAEAVTDNGIVNTGSVQLAQTGETDTPPPARRLNPTGRTVQLQVPFLDQDRPIGTVLLQITADDELSLDAAGVAPLLDGILAPDAIDQLVGNAVGDRIGPDAFAAAGLTLVYDPGLLELRLESPVEARPQQGISLGRESAPPPGVQRPADVSAFVNLRAGLSHTSDDDEPSEFNEFRVDAEGALRLFKPVLEFEANFENDLDGGGGEFNRRGTRVLYDDLERALRYGAGDLFVPGVSFQDSIDLLGVGVSRDFGLQPSRNVRPTAGRRFSLARPSDVEVVINGFTVRRLRLQPGTYDLRDIPLTAGTNDIELVITDNTGAEERISFSRLFSTDLLAPGTFEFALAAGALADVGTDSPEYEEDEILLTGHTRLGLLPWLTLGANGQASEVRQQAGIESQFATPFGSFSTAAAASDVENLGSGTALGLDFKFLFADPDPLARSLTLSAESLSRNFDGVDSNEDIGVGEVPGTPDNDTVLDLTLNYGQDIGEMRGSLGLEYGFGRDGSEDDYRVGANLSGRLGLRSTWNLRLEYLRDDDFDDDGLSAFVGIAIPLGDDRTVSVDLDTGDRSLRTTYAVDGGNNVGDVGGSLTVGTNEDDKLELEGDIDATANRFRASASHDSRFTELRGSDRVSTTRLGFDTAIAFAGGRFAVGRPVGDSFAILFGHPSLEGRPILAAPGPDGVTARSGALGPALVPNLGSFNTRRLEFDVEDLPTGYDLGEGVFVLQPPFAAGYALQVGSDATITVLGTMVFDDGEPVSLIGGTAVSLDDPDFPPITIFTNRVGRFAVLGVKPGRYELRMLSDPPQTVEIEVPEDTVGLLRAGTLTLSGN